MERRQRWLRQHPLCIKCDELGRTTLGTEVDHIIPLSQGGKDDESNMQTLCSACHFIKTQSEAFAARVPG